MFLIKKIYFVYFILIFYFLFIYLFIYLYICLFIYLFFDWHTKSYPQELMLRPHPQSRHFLNFFCFRAFLTNMMTSFVGT